MGETTRAGTIPFETTVTGRNVQFTGEGQGISVYHDGHCYILCTIYITIAIYHVFVGFILINYKE